jgi:tRNA modification GTPase
MTNNTIAAISTPLGPGGIGIVRISGPGAYPIMKRLFVRKNQDFNSIDKRDTGDRFTSHRVYYGHLFDPGSENRLDEVLAIYMKAPKSFTREDVVEFHSHSGFVVLDRILSAVVDAGATLAGPGAFSKRAFLSGRIDLTQAEAVIDLINAPCETAVQMANSQVAGEFREVLEGITARITTLQAACEASIEFSDSVDDGGLLLNVLNSLKTSFVPVISELIQREKETAIFKEGLLLAIAGVPNVGKSSLLNRLVDKETAIVSEVPGTTRDIVREYFSIKGVPVIICDTAGIHNTSDPVECIGIQKARDHFNQADMVLLVIEGTRRLNDFEEKLVDEFKHARMIAVINKDDLADEDAIFDIQKQIKGISNIRVSAKTGTGMSALKELIFKDLVSGKTRVKHEGATPNLRQRKILEKILQELLRGDNAAETEQAIVNVSELLNTILNLLNEILGDRKKEDLYDNIFSQFCVGK